VSPAAQIAPAATVFEPTAQGRAVGAGGAYDPAMPATARATEVPLAVAEGAAGTAASGSTTSNSSAPAWTSPALIGPHALAGFKTLAAGIEPAAGTPPVQGGNNAIGAGGGDSAPAAPGAPCNGGSTSASGVGGPSGGWVAVPVTRVVCWPASALRRLQLPAALWRPVAFVSLQERPG
jgi:hypothetical protein